MDKKAEDNFGMHSKLSDSKNFLMQLLKEYPVLKTLGLMGGGALIGSLGAKAGNRLGLNINPSLVGWAGALAPLAIQALTGDDTIGNLDRKGLKSLYTPTSHLRNLPNRKGYVAKHLSKQLAGTRLPDHELLYGNLGKNSPAFDGRTDHQKYLDDLQVDARLEGIYS